MPDQPSPTSSRLRWRARALVTITAIGLAASASVAVAQRGSPPRITAHGVVQVLKLRRAGAPSDVWVYRPAVAESASLPVLYFLHGLPGKASDLFHAGLAAAMDRYIAAGGVPFVVAAPDGNSTTHADTEWGDASNGSDSLESFFIDTVIPAVEEGHPRTPGNRAIGGFSMGGYGAVNIAEQHPDLFGAVVSVAGYFKLDDPSRMFATAAAKVANTPNRNVGQLAGKRILLVAAAEESDPLIEGQSASLARRLASAGIEATQITASGTHSWSLVASQLPRIERFLAAGWR